jgi:hypothetical protein
MVLMKKLLVFCVFGMLLCCGGCVRAIAALATPTSSEIKIPPEYDLGKNKPQKILVLVEQPVWTASEVNIRLYLTQAIASKLADTIGIKPEMFVPYQKLADMRNNMADFAMLSPVEVGKGLAANMVLYVVIDNFGLYGLSDAGYYRGQLDVRSGLYDVASGQRLWPEAGELKATSVTFEVQKEQEKAAQRLAVSTAKCIVRYFYDCPKPDFKVVDERKKDTMESW